MLLTVPAVLAFALAADRRPARYNVSFTNIELLASLGQPTVRRRRWLPLGLFLLALTSASLAVARPQIKIDGRTRLGTIVLLVDVSGSMRSTDIEPNRLAAAEHAMTVFLDRLPSRYRVGLVAFSTWPEVLVEPTTNRTAVQESINLLGPGSGTAIGDGLAAAVRLARTSLGAALRRQGTAPIATILLLSDGTQTNGRLSPLQGATLARRAGIRVDTVALGTTHGVANESGVGGPGPLGSVVGFGGATAATPPDLETLDSVARQGTGTSYVARSNERLDHVYRQIASSILRRTTKREISSWSAGLAALFLLLSVAGGLRRAPRLP